MKYRYEYLDGFNPDADIPYNRLPYSKPLSEINLDNLFYLPENVRGVKNIPALQPESPCLHGEKLRFVSNKLNASGIYIEALETLPISEVLEQLKEFYHFGTLSDSDYYSIKKLIE